MTMSWKVAALRRLAEPDSPRVFGREELTDWLAGANIEPGQRTLARALQEWEAAGLIERPTWGVYLNSRAIPVPVREEAIAFMRPGAVLSLTSVLGRSGALNNPSYWVTAVVPMTTFKGPLEVEASDGGVFRFAYMRPDLIPTLQDDWAKDALERHAHVATATPEKALMDLLYLSSSARGAARWSLPALHDLDMTYFDEGRLDRLAKRMDLELPLEQLREAINNDKPRLKVSRKSRPG